MLVGAGGARLELLLVNARHVKILPGRKTDVGAAAWLCELLECGLLRGSFVPPPQIRELRDLVRYRKRLIQAHGAECQRIQKTLEDAGIKLDSVAARGPGRLGPGDAGRAGRRRTRPPGPGGAGQGQAAQEASPVAPSPAGPLRRASWAAGRAGAWAPGASGGRDRPPRRPCGRGDRPVRRGP